MTRRGAHLLDGRRAKRVFNPAVHALRAVAGEESVLEERIKRALRIDLETRRAPGYVEWQGSRAAALRSTLDTEPRTGIYLRGACDLIALFDILPLLRQHPRGTVGIGSSAHEVEATRADVLLQALDPLPSDATKEVRKRLKLPHDYFEPNLFSPTFTLRGLRNLGVFPKTVVVLSLAPNVVRTVYRHREHGFLVDPGGWWLGDPTVALRDPDTVTWFRDNFEQAGRLTLDEFGQHFRSVVRLVQEKALAQHILVFNVLTVEPGDRAHNYQLRRHPESMRQREFCLALVDLSRELGFHIVDVDRILKREGVDRQLDFAHFPTDLSDPISADVFRILRSLDVV